MKLSAQPLERRLQISGILLTLSLLVEALCLLWARPIAFILFLGLGGLLLVGGVAIYLYSLVSTGQPER